jgi:hypothetical protein
MAYCLILSLFVLVKAVADSASSIILLTSGTKVERSLFRRFLFLPQLLLLPATSQHLTTTRRVYTKAKSSRHKIIPDCAPVASMSESPRHPNPGLNGYQQDVMHAEVGCLVSCRVANIPDLHSCLDYPLHLSCSPHLLLLFWCSMRKHKHRSSLSENSSTSWRAFGVSKYCNLVFSLNQSTYQSIFHLHLPQPDLN